jgi:hypothetical protein
VSASEVSYTDRVWVAMRVARDVGTCCDLLEGKPVDESRLDPLGLAWALQMRFVRLDVSAIDLFFAELRELAA